MKRLLTALIVTGILAGCNSEQSATAAPKQEVATPHYEVQVVEDAPQEAPIMEELTPLEPATPITPTPTPAPPAQPSTPVVTVPELPPKLPIFIGEGITTHTQQPYSGTLTKCGDSYLRHNQDAQYFNDFELPEWTVEYKYEPFLEVLITDGTETLCARYSWKLKGFGYARPNCLWSDTRAVVPLEDMQSAYYGYSVVEIRVWVNGVKDLSIEIK